MKVMLPCTEHDVFIHRMHAEGSDLLVQSCPGGRVVEIDYEAAMRAWERGGQGRGFRGAIENMIAAALGVSDESVK